MKKKSKIETQNINGRRRIRKKKRRGKAIKSRDRKGGRKQR